MTDTLTDDRDGREIAWYSPAKDEDVRTVLDAPLDTGEGRSAWVWLRLVNGDLALAVFPQGATYEVLEGRTEV